MITEKVLRLWFKDISEKQVKELQDIYAKTYERYKRMKIWWFDEFDNIFKWIKKYEKTKDFTIAKFTIVNKAKLDIAKDDVYYLFMKNKQKWKN